MRDLLNDFFEKFIPTEHFQVEVEKNDEASDTNGEKADKKENSSSRRKREADEAAAQPTKVDTTPATATPKPPATTQQKMVPGKVNMTSCALCIYYHPECG